MTDIQQERDARERLIRTAAILVEAARAERRSVEHTIACTRDAGETEARLAYAIDALNAIPRFFFHFAWAEGITPDHCGVELPDLATARNWAETEARRLLDPEWPLGLDPTTGVITIVDQDGNALDRVAVRDVLPSQA